MKPFEQNSQQARLHLPRFIWVARDCLSIPVFHICRSRQGTELEGKSPQAKEAARRTSVQAPCMQPHACALWVCDASA